MSLIKRLSTTLFARIDQVVGEIENHDALIHSTIAEERKKIAAAKVQLARLQGSAQQMGRQINELEQQERLWSERAVKAAGEDEARALACLERRRLVRGQREQLLESRSQFQATAERMSGDITASEGQLKELSQKHSLMRARQSSAEALGVVGRAGEVGMAQLDESFARWEMRITEEEIAADRFDPLDATDTLEQSFLSEERAQELRAELAELLDGSEPQGRQGGEDDE